jgi:uncharacterized protein (DUF1800 family)
LPIPSPAADADAGPGPAAWSNDLSPIAPQDWSYERASHLLERAGFGGTPEEIQRLAAMTPQEAVRYLVRFQTVDNSQLQPFDHSGVFDAGLDPFPASRPATTDQAKAKGEALGVKVKPGGNRPMQPVVNKFFYWLRASRLETDRVSYWWANRMLTTNRPLEEKMALFWHGHFANNEDKVRDYRKMLQQLELFQSQGTGSFRGLMIGVAQGPAMLAFLDAGVNVKGAPNENFAREIMELFTMGVGFYTEPDVYAGARVFTGWNLQRSGSADASGYYRFVYNAGAHETTAKEFSFPIYPDGSKTIPARSAADGMQDGLDLIDALARNPETGRRLARKLYAFFVSELNDPDEQLINQAAQVYQQSGFSMAAVLRTLLLSRAFNSPSNHFTRYSWPVEYVVRAMKEVGYAGFSVNSAIGPLINMGQQLFEPPDVSGWDLGQSWFSTGAMLARMNFAATLTQNQKNNIAVAVRGNGPTPEALLSFYLDQLTPLDYDRPAYDDLLGYLRESVTWNGSYAQLAVKAPGLLHLIVGSSEYQFV